MESRGQDDVTPTQQPELIKVFGTLYQPDTRAMLGTLRHCKFQVEFIQEGPPKYLPNCKVETHTGEIIDGDFLAVFHQLMRRYPNLKQLLFPEEKKKLINSWLIYYQDEFQLHSRRVVSQLFLKRFQKDMKLFQRDQGPLSREKYGYIGDKLRDQNTKYLAGDQLTIADLLFYMECSYFIVTRDRVFNENQHFYKWYYEVMNQYDELTYLNDRFKILYNNFLEEGHKQYAADDTNETMKAGIGYMVQEKVEELKFADPQSKDFETQS